MRLQLIIIAMFLVNLARYPLEALYSKLLEARWPGFHDDLHSGYSGYSGEPAPPYESYYPPAEPGNNPCGYCRKTRPSDDTSEVCADCWEEIQAAEVERLSHYNNEPTYPSPEEMVEHPDPLPNPEPITLAEAFAFLRDEWPIEADPPLKASEAVAIAQDHMNREGE